MSVISWPSDCMFRPTKMRWEQISNTAINISQFNGALSSLGMPGARWAMQLTFEFTSKEDRHKFDAILWQLRGQENRLAMWNFDQDQPRGNYRGNLTVKNAFLSGVANCVVRGGTPNGTLKRDDMLSINGELKSVVADAQADAQGEIAIQFEPSARTAAVANAPVRWFRPRALFISKEGTLGFLREGSQNGELTLDFIEAWFKAAPSTIVTPDPQLVSPDPEVLASSLLLEPAYAANLSIFGP